MSMFENDHYRWRETYFVLFDAKKRPTTDKVKKALQGLHDRFEVTNVRGDAHHHLESLTILAPDDFAALDVCFVAGDEVREQVEQLSSSMDLTLLDPGDRQKVKRIGTSDARFDVLHFEQLADDAAGDEGDDDLLDPSAVLLVLEALAHLTEGVAVDPQSGTIL